MKKWDCRDQESNENEEDNHYRHRGYKSSSTNKIRHKPSEQYGQQTRKQTKQNKKNLRVKKD